jgi:predicted RNase H-like nuclease
MAPRQICVVLAISNEVLDCLKCSKTRRIDVKILNPQTNCLIVGFDSAWTDKPSAPGAITALGFGPDCQLSFFEPALVSFNDALSWIEDRRQHFDLCLIAIDQPTIVPNLSGSRPADRVAASVISFIGGGVQPANRSKIGMFNDDAPIWHFMERLRGVSLSIEHSRSATRGLFLIEVFPALALSGLNSDFYKRSQAPKYNPANRKKFNLEHWRAVVNTVRDVTIMLKLTHLTDWVDKQWAIANPKKADQDKLDSVICLLIGLMWRACEPRLTMAIGDGEKGYMVTAASDETRQRLEAAATKIDLQFTS